ncbi:MAG: outer membrane beta-barrel protein [Xanthomonadaceae bacterium]|jgi:outer membrane protein|nr:outer membrane beta-barrel protein [Xanthomonadaceae bacterium]
MRKTTKLFASSLAVALTAAVALPAMAQSQGDWTLGAGLGLVNPKSNNGNLVGDLRLDVKSSTRPTLTFEYFVYDNLGVEVLAAWPFKHDINIRGLGRVGTTKQLPPTVSLQYHFNSQGTVSPFVGVGLNYTTFFSTKSRGVLRGGDLKLGSSWGVAGHAGLDFAIGERGAIRADVRWMDIDSRVKLDGVRLGTANVDPWVYGVSYIWKF